ncbi:MAG: polysaccharide export protein [Chthoniobacter sp.]|nr:polysaccharide export protein [Chthoniobacter sp.]
MAHFRVFLLCLSGLFLSVGRAWTQAPAPEKARPAETAPNSVLSANDVIEIKVFQEPDLDTTARLGADGKVVLPLIGEVTLAGKTVQEAGRIIRDRLEARFLVDPQITLRVLEQTRRLFTILGQVQRPGTFRFPDREGLNLIQVIGVAGGYTRLADPARVTVKRNVNGRESVFKIDARKMAGDAAIKPFEVQPGDMITVGERLF